jgi:hypothetical protein
VREARHVLGAQPHSDAEAHPLGEPPLAFSFPVVVVDSPYPRSPERRILRFRDQDRVFDGDARLVVIAILHPALDLLLRELALVHLQVERMAIVVARAALLAQPLHERLVRQDLFRHASISIPS